MGNVPRIFLVGPRGSGKTTVAQPLAQHLGWHWLDADERIEARAGQSIRAIFADEGEAGFRKRETDILRELTSGPERCVIATGGGIVLFPDNRDRLRTSGRVVYLTADIDTLWRRIANDSTSAERRPALSIGGREEVAQIVAAREPLYRACAHHIVDTSDRSAEEVATDILIWWQGS